MEPPFDTGLTCGQLVLKEWVDEVGADKMGEYMGVIQAVLSDPQLWRDILADIPNDFIAVKQSQADQTTMMLREAWDSLTGLCPGGRNCRHN